MNQQALIEKEVLVMGLRLDIQRMQRDISNLRSRVAILQKENLDLKAQVANQNWNKRLRSGSADESRSSGNQKKDDAVIVHTAHGSIKYRETCNFCDPFRCRGCEDKNLKLPSVISLLIKNGFFNMKDVGRIARVNSSLQQFICVGSDDDVWLNLLHEQWPSTSMMPVEVRQRLSNRDWYKRLHFAKKRSGTYDGWGHNDNERFIKDRRGSFRYYARKPGGSDGEFTPLPAPSLSPNDVLFLIDIKYYRETYNPTWHDFVTRAMKKGSMLASAALHGDTAKPLFDACNCDSLVEIPLNAIKSIPLKLRISNGIFVPDRNTSESVLVVRLTDFKVMDVFERDSFGFTHFSNYAVSIDATVDDLARGKYILSGHEGLGYVPTELTSRMGASSEDRFTGLRFHLCPIEISLPRSPYSFGHEYTVAKYREHVAQNRNANNNVLEFSEFVRNLWRGNRRNASDNPELTKFFRQAMEGISADGKFYGTVHSMRLYIEPCFAKSGKTCFGDDMMSGVSLLHILEYLFENDAKSLPASAEERYDDDDDEYYLNVNHHARFM